MNKVTWIIFSVLTVGILGALVLISGNSRIDVSNVDINAISVGNNQNGNIAEHVFGKADSPVTLINYGDFQCPGCATAHTLIRSVTEEYQDQLRFVFRNFPLTSIHPNAKAAAGAVEAAGLQGKYWEMHNKVYESQDKWNLLSGSERNDFFVGYATELGLDIAKFNSDLASKSVADKINYDYSVGKKAEVEATPTFFLNGVKLDGEVWGDETKFKELIDAELTKAGIPLPL